MHDWGRAGRSASRCLQPNPGGAAAAACTLRTRPRLMTVWLGPWMRFLHVGKHSLSSRRRRVRPCCLQPAAAIIASRCRRCPRCHLRCCVLWDPTCVTARHVPLRQAPCPRTHASGPSNQSAKCNNARPCAQGGAAGSAGRRPPAPWGGRQTPRSAGIWNAWRAFPERIELRGGPGTAGDRCPAAFAAPPCPRPALRASQQQQLERPQCAASGPPEGPQRVASCGAASQHGRGSGG